MLTANVVVASGDGLLKPWLPTVYSLSAVPRESLPRRYLQALSNAVLILSDPPGF